uniref:Uncharacterized protein n=1 Tax=Panagrolaimus sp. PS1159 TaxID=55785 RepID=A0AC35GCL3_9BILA
MISAISNLIAMYPGSLEQAGRAYPNLPGWPSYEVGGKKVGFVPIPIHTVNDFYDYELNPDAICPRQDQLWKLVEETPEYKKETENQKDLLKTVAKLSGENVTLTNLWLIADALFIEKTWNKTWNTGFTKDLFQQINDTNDLVEYWNNGLKLNKYRGIDFSIELPKIRGGPLMKTLIDNMQMKLNCTTSNNTYEYCSVFKNLKYHAFSAHDTTLAALFSILRFNYTNWNEDGYPHYSSAISLELWKNNDGTNTVKFIYFPLKENNIDHDEIEIDIPPCSGSCTIESLISNFKKFGNETDPATLCNTDINPDANGTAKICFNFWNFVFIFVFGLIFKICV